MSSSREDSSHDPSPLLDNIKIEEKWSSIEDMDA